MERELIKSKVLYCRQEGRSEVSDVEKGLALVSLAAIFLCWTDKALWD